MRHIGEEAAFGNVGFFSPSLSLHNHLVVINRKHNAHDTDINVKAEKRGENGVGVLKYVIL